MFDHGCFIQKSGVVESLVTGTNISVSRTHKGQHKSHIDKVRGLRIVYKYPKATFLSAIALWDPLLFPLVLVFFDYQEIEKRERQMTNRQRQRPQEVASACKYHVLFKKCIMVLETWLTNYLDYYNKQFAQIIAVTS